MTRRDILLAASAALSKPLTKALVAAPLRPPNIIFILADDLGWGDPGCYGNRELKTPNLDRLAQEGTRFQQFYVSSPVCSPSRASFLTGQFVNRHHIYSYLLGKEANQRRGLPQFLDPNQTLLPKLLHNAGYATAHYGKWHLGACDEMQAPPPTMYGFDAHRTLRDNGDGIQRVAEDIPGWNVWKGAREGPDWHEFKARSSELIVDETIRFVESHRNQPFYIDTWFFDPHARLTPTALQMKPYADFGTPFRIYYGAVTNLDEQVGRLLRRLDELELANDTLVLFSSDNGPDDIHVKNASEHGVGDPGPFRGRKYSGYEGGIRLPLIARWPGHIPAGRVDESTVVSGVDFLPTLCKLAGVQPPGRTAIGGEDMSGALLGHPIERSRPLFWDLRFNTPGDFINKCPHLAIRDGRWKLFMNPDGSSVELYDIVRNSLEVDNLADTHPDVVRRLSQMLMKWRDDPQASF
jgi:arylsulfatase A-like enzyme